MTYTKLMTFFVTLASATIASAQSAFLWEFSGHIDSVIPMPDAPDLQAGDTWSATGTTHEGWSRLRSSLGPRAYSMSHSFVDIGMNSHSRSGISISGDAGRHEVMFGDAVGTTLFPFNAIFWPPELTGLDTVEFRTEFWPDSAPEPMRLLGVLYFGSDVVSLAEPEVLASDYRIEDVVFSYMEIRTAFTNRLYAQGTIDQISIVPAPHAVLPLSFAAMAASRRKRCG